mmetsp:Transcript_7645/g.31631  ORF Transcript_7645/g.31631 Transcript_7645/m.31631 type:complete len:84 (-) Transcript_7645:604-855(-)
MGAPRQVRSKGRSTQVLLDTPRDELPTFSFEEVRRERREPQKHSHPQQPKNCALIVCPRARDPPQLEKKDAVPPPPPEGLPNE